MFFLCCSLIWLCRVGTYLIPGCVNGTRQSWLRRQQASCLSWRSWLAAVRPGPCGSSRDLPAKQQLACRQGLAVTQRVLQPEPSAQPPAADSSGTGNFSPDPPISGGTSREFRPGCDCSCTLRVQLAAVLPRGAVKAGHRQHWPAPPPAAPTSGSSAGASGSQTLGKSLRTSGFQLSLLLIQE